MKVCLVSSEILGAHKNGGIGTATSNLALLFAQGGHEVTLFYVGKSALISNDGWSILYNKANINVVHYSTLPAQINPSWMKRPVGIFEELRGKKF